MLYIMIEENLTQWRGEAIDDVTHPLDIEQKWTDEELHAVGLYKAIDETPTLESNQFIESSSLELIDNVVHTVYEIGEIPQEENAIDNYRAGLKCSKLQAVAILYEYGLLDKVEAIVEAADPMVKLAWNHTTVFERNSIIVNALGPLLTWPDETPVTEEDLDQIFEAAAGLKF